MGTRSNIRIHDGDDKLLCCLYRQFDGYPAGVGCMLQDFVEDKVMVNGFNEEDGSQINGPGDFATMFITWDKGLGDNKVSTGNLYMMRPNHKVGSSWEEYCYDIFFDKDGEPVVTVIELHDKKYGGNKVLCTKQPLRTVDMKSLKSNK